MKRLGAVAAVGLGVLLILLGLLFLVGSAGQARRLAVAGVGLALGALATGLGVRAWRRAEALAPERLRADILELARERNGEVAESEVAAALGDRLSAARPVLDALLAGGDCQRRVTGDAVYLVFPAFQPRLMARACEYCGAELPIAEEVATCPKCGGAVTTRVVRRSLSAGEAFAMDEEEGAARPS
jgi:hypothetical protein